jgi:hypothetical protein
MPSAVVDGLHSAPQDGSSARSTSTTATNQASFANRTDFFNSLLDLFRYSSTGVAQTTSSGPAYFSLDGAVNGTSYAFNTTTGGDLGDWASSVGSDSYEAFLTSGTNGVSPTDVKVMQALGWTSSGYQSDSQINVPVTASTALAAFHSGSAPAAIVDSAANVQSNIDALGTLAAANGLASITLTDTATNPGPTVSVTAAQFAADAAALKLITTGFTLAVTGVTAANATAVAAQAAALAGISISDDYNAIAISITDSSANVMANLSALQTITANWEIGSITFSDSNASVTVTESLFKADSRLFSLLTNASLSITNVAAADVSSLYTPYNSTVVITDASANVAANLGTIYTSTYNHTFQLDLTDAGSSTLAVTGSQWASYHSLIQQMRGSFTVAINGASVSSITPFIGNALISSVSISDTATNISGNLDSLQRLATSHILSGVTVTDSKPIAVSVAQITSDANVLALLPANYTLSISTDAASAASVANLPHVASVSVTDSSANLSANLDSLETLAAAGKLSGVSSADYSALAITAAQEAADAQALAKFDYYSIDLIVPAAQAGTALNQPHVTEVTIADTAADISANIGTIATLANSLNVGNITVTDGGTIQVSYDTYDHQSNWRYFLSGTYGIAVSGVDYGSVSWVLADTHVVSVGITDAAAEFSYQIDALELRAKAEKLSGVAFTESGTPTVTLTATQMTSDSDALALITTPYALSVTGVTVANVSSIAANSHIAQVSVSDTLANISAGLSTLSSIPKLGSVAVSDYGGTLTLNQAQWSADQSVVASMTGNFYLVLKGVSVASALEVSPTHLQSITIADSAANVAAHLDMLESLTQSGASVSITLTDAGTPVLSLTTAQIANDSQALADIHSPYTPSINGSVTVAALAANNHPTAPVRIADTAEQIGANLDLLQSDIANGTVTGISLTDGGTPTVSITAAQITSDARALAAISTPHHLAVFGISVAGLQSMLSQPNVTFVGASDTAAHISADLDGLQSLLSSGKLDAVEVSDGANITISQTQLTNDAGLLNIMGGYYGTLLQGVTAAGAASAASLNDVTSVSVSDSASNVVANIAALETLAQSGRLTSIALTDSGTPALALSASQITADAQVLATITSPYTVAATGLSVTAFLSPTNSLSSASIADTTANVLGNLDRLEASVTAGKLTSIALTDGGTPSFTITNAQLTGDATALHDIVGSFSLAVSGVSTSALSTVLATGHVASAGVIDNAANIGADLDTLQSLISSGKVTSIALTDSGTPTLTVTAAQMISDAQAINDIAGSFTLSVTGDAAQVSQLTPTVLSHVKSLSVSDSAANISSDLDSLQTIAAAGKLTGIAVTGTTYAALTVTTSQLTSDATVLKELTGNYVLDVTAPTTGGTITGSAGVGNIVSFAGNVSDYTITPGANGAVTVTSASGTEHLSGIDAIQIGSQTDIIAATPAKGGTANTGNLTELYGAVFSRTPDVPGLGFYQAYLSSHPNTPLTQFATWFLDSGEYQSNTAHNYAQTTTGETQFITDSYQNLLHRTPSADEVNFYLNNVITPAVNGLTAGSSAYGAADAQAHALLLVYFSASAEFLGDVQITAQNPSSAQHWLLLTS